MEDEDYRIPYSELTEPLPPDVESSMVALQVVAVYIYEIAPNQWAPLVILHTGDFPAPVLWWFGVRPTREDAESSVHTLFAGIARARVETIETHPSIPVKDLLWNEDGTPRSAMPEETKRHFEKHVMPLLKGFKGRVPAEPAPRSGVLVDPRS